MEFNETNQKVGTPNLHAAVPYVADDNRYSKMVYRRCGRSGLLLPAISLGLWHNFGEITPFGTQQKVLRTAFDNGITHFDLANNYGPPYGEAERNFGIHMLRDWKPYRDELVISTKAGWDMWPGPYGDFGSRKYLMASLNQSLKRMGLEYVDIFYSHRPDPNTPLEETMGALADIVRQGKALYVGISNYDADQTKRAVEILAEHKVPCLVHQARYSMMDRWTEPALLPLLKEKGVGMVAFSPLAQGLLTNRYLNGIPADSRAAKNFFLQKSTITPELVAKLQSLNDIAAQRGQSLAEMALAWILKDERVTSVIVGASSVNQLNDSLKALNHLEFSQEELNKIDQILKTMN